MEEKLRSYIHEALAGLSLGEAAFTLEHPADMAHGDYATNAAMVAAKQAKKNPRELAEAIALAMRAKGDPDIAAVDVAGPGFINFKLSDAFFMRAIGEILDAKDEWGKNDLYKGETHLFDYTDPNPFKVFHIGHLMSNAIGEALARLAEFSGARVVRICYGGDVGPHVAKTLWGIRHGDMPLPDEPVPLTEKMKFLGDAYVRGANAYEDDPAAKTEIDALNKKIYANDAEVRDMWEKGKAWSVAHFEEIYRKLGTAFDHQRFESEVALAGARVVRAHIGDVFAKSDGAIIYRGDEASGLHTRVFLNKDGIPTYEAKEIGHTEWKFTSYPDAARSVVVTANEQNDYFKVITAVLLALHPEWAGRMKQIGHGMMRFAAGKMSSRKGNVVSGEDLLDALRERLHERFAGTSRAAEDLVLAVAVAGVKFTVLRQSSGKDIVFDPEQSLSIEGDSGPYLEYTHARLSSVLTKAAESGIAPAVSGPATPIGLLEKLLVRFPEVVRRAAAEDAPHHVANYLVEVARAFNSYYGHTQIVDGSPEVHAKVALAAATRYTLGNGLWVLGIVAPEKM